MLKPQLVMDENNQVAMQIRLGSYTATLPIPDHLAGQTEAELQSFFDKVVPSMMAGLRDMQRNDQRKLRKKAQCANVSTASSQDLEEETSPPPPPHLSPSS